MIYTLKSLLECVTRAVTLAQPADILKFESQYFLELLEFGKTMPGIDHAELIFHFQDDGSTHPFRLLIVVSFIDD
uniref:RIIa domain-containing protein n=2 Tax=Xiphophorus TaxID=8082 RepID=A0A3B5QPS0_XIPMA